MEILEKVILTLSGFPKWDVHIIALCLFLITCFSIIRFYRFRSVGIGITAIGLFLLLLCYLLSMIIYSFDVDFFFSNPFESIWNAIVFLSELIGRLTIVIGLYIILFVEKTQ